MQRSPTGLSLHCWRSSAVVQAVHEDFSFQMRAELPALKKWKTRKAMKWPAEDEPPCTKARAPLTPLCTGQYLEPASPPSMSHRHTMKTFTSCKERRGRFEFLNLRRPVLDFLSLLRTGLLLISRAENGRSPRTSMESAAPLTLGIKKEMEN